MTTVMVRPVDAAELPPPPENRKRPPRYQSVVLDVRSGELRFHCRDWRAKLSAAESAYARWAQHYPGSLIEPRRSPELWFDEVPAVVRWTIEPADGARRWLTAEEGNEFVASVAWLAQLLLDGLQEVAGTADLDWSPESASAAMNIWRACQPGRLGPLDRRCNLVSMAQAVEALPGLVDPEWADLGDPDLDAQVEDLASRATPQQWQRELAKLWHFKALRHSDGFGGQLEILGARSWLYRYRADRAGERRVVDAGAWFADPARTLAGRVSADADESELERLAAGEQVAAEREGIKLVGAIEVVRAYRDQQRERGGRAGARRQADANDGAGHRGVSSTRAVAQVTEG